MLTISRQIACFQSRKYLLFNYRSICSGRAPRILSKSSFGSTNNDGSKREGYGEKEISLLGPDDARTPLPGNTGIPPFSMLYTSKIQQLPKPAGEKCEVIQSPLPEERYQNLLTQAICVAAENALTSPNKLECMGFKCPQLLKKDFSDLFPHRDLSGENLTVITFCHKTENDMSTWSETAEKERGDLEHYFTATADAICAHLKQLMYWADFIHPNSGKPHLGPLTSATMFETDLRYRNFGFSIEDLGCCRIISHHLWGTNIFIGAIFTNATLESRAVQDVLNRTQSGEISIFSDDIL